MWQRKLLTSWQPGSRGRQRKTSETNYILQSQPPHDPLPPIGAPFPQSLLPEKYTWKLLWFLHLSGKRRIQARCKNSVKVMVQFIRTGLHFQQTESGLSVEWDQPTLGSGGTKERETFTVPHTRNGSKDSKWRPPSLSLTLESWGNTCGQSHGSGWLGWLLKQGGVIPAPGVISWIWVIVLLRETLSSCSDWWRICLKFLTFALSSS
jgi:hypothetical protein